MFRSVGSAIFGLFSDRFGRKWPFIVNNLLFIILELVSVSTYDFMTFLERRLACFDYLLTTYALVEFSRQPASVKRIISFLHAALSSDSPWVACTATPPPQP
jgi:MFS family permease